MNILFAISFIISLTHINTASGSEHIWKTKVSDVLKEFLVQIKNLRDEELQDVTKQKEGVDPELAGGLSKRISSKLANRESIFNLKKALEKAEADKGAKIQECREKFDSLLKDLIEDLEDTTVAKSEDNLSAIDDTLALIKKNLDYTEKRIQSELANPDIEGAMCENDNRYCILMDELTDDLEMSLGTLNRLELALPYVVENSLHWIGSDRVTDKIKKELSEPVKKCLEQ